MINNFKGEKSNTLVAKKETEPRKGAFRCLLHAKKIGCTASGPKKKKKDDLSAGKRIASDKEEGLHSSHVSKEKGRC